MDNQVKYKFYCRPEYGSENVLIEFFWGAGGEAFEPDLFDAIKEINPKLVGKEDLWMNDEILYKINSDLGQFTLSKDIWGFVFLMSDNSQSCIIKINKLLLDDNRFEKIEVDYDNYKLST